MSHVTHANREPHTIGNPASWTVQEIGALGHVLREGIARLRMHRDTLPAVRRLTLDDLSEALAAGWDDFAAMRSDVAFLCLFYPLAGLVMFWIAGGAGGAGGAHLIGPLIVAFALMGPAFAAGLYEMSRRRAAGEAPAWSAPFALFASPAIVPVLVLGGFYALLAGLWLLTAQVIHSVTLGPEAPGSLWALLHAAFARPEGWEMIALGVLFGGFYGLVALVAGFIAFPMLVDPDRNASLVAAVATSLRVARANPVVTLLWGALVFGVVMIAAIPFLVGLVVAFPVLGHATWHLYRRAVA